jgi:arylsulfatase A-like enzyme
MTAERDRPFFAVASFVNPHDICFAHRAKVRAAEGSRKRNALYEEAVGLPDGRLPALPENFGIQQGEPAAVTPDPNVRKCTPPGVMRRDYTERDWRVYRWIYCRHTERVDAEIGVMLEGLKRADLLKNTVIVFTSDHGDMDASHRLASKSLMYEQSACVPMIVSGPGIQQPGRVDSRHLVSTGLDILPTLCDYAGIEIPSHCLGQSLRPLVENREVDDRRSYVASENYFSRMIRTTRFKYCSYGTGAGEESLVDIERDPGEMRNLASDPASGKTLDEHRLLLKQWCEVSADPRASEYVRAAKL